MNEQVRFIDLFCGIGGIRIGMESQGFECVFSSDINVECQKTYEENFGEKPLGDITKRQFPTMTFSVPTFLASRLASLENKKGLTIQEGLCSLKFVVFSTRRNRLWFSSKMLSIWFITTTVKH